MDRAERKKKRNKRYLPHPVSAEESAVRLYRKTKDIGFALHRAAVAAKTVPLDYRSSLWYNKRKRLL